MGLHLGEARSLKDKRQVVRRVLDRLRGRNLSACEVEAHNLWQRAELGLALVAADEAVARGALERAVRAAEEASGLKTLEVRLDFLRC